jgi:hypothetical protein
MGFFNSFKIQYSHPFPQKEQALLLSITKPELHLMHSAFFVSLLNSHFEQLSGQGTQIELSFNVKYVLQEQFPDL